MKKFKNNNSGFTMVELVIATMVLTVIMVPLMRAFMVGANLTGRASTYGKTTSAIENVMEVVQGAEMDQFGAYMTALALNDAAVDTSNVAANGTGTYIVEPSNFQGLDNQRVQVTVKEVDSADPLYTLNGADLASYTNMDMSLIQVEEHDPDKYGFERLSGQFSGFNWNNMTDVERAIDIKMSFNGYYDIEDTLSATDQLVTVAEYETYYASNIARLISEAETAKINEILATLPPGSSYTLTAEESANVALAVEVELERVWQPVLSYVVSYSYSATHNGVTKRASVDVFTGAIKTGVDKIAALQLVYFPLFGDPGKEAEEFINITYEPGTDAHGNAIGHLPDGYELRLFLIKQKRVEHSYTCSSSSFAGGIGTFTAGSCLNCSSSGAENRYHCTVTLDEGHTRTGEEIDSKLFSNINVDMYNGGMATDTYLKFELLYGTNGVDTMSLTNFLVQNVTGERIYRVFVDVCSIGGCSGSLGSGQICTGTDHESTSTVKFN